MKEEDSEKKDCASLKKFSAPSSVVELAVLGLNWKLEDEEESQRNLPTPLKASGGQSNGKCSRS